MTDFFVGVALTLFDELFRENPAITVIISIIAAAVIYLLMKTSLSKCFARISLDHHKLKLQMDQVEESSDKVETDLQGLFLTMRYEILGTKDGLIDDAVVAHFNLVLNLIKKKAIKKLLRMLKADKGLYADMSDVEIRSYGEMKAAALFRDLKEIYNNWYPKNIEPTVEAFYDRYTQEKKAEIKMMIIESFVSARKVAIDFQDKKYIKKYFKELA